MKPFRKLKEDEIDIKVGSVTNKGYTLLLYKNARVDMAILDEAVGVENWQNKFYEVVGNLYCSLGINVGKVNKGEDCWVWKDDCGVESDFGDKEKGQASDARKRAGFAWGIGRELYTAPHIFIACETEQNSNGKGYHIKNYADIYRSNTMKVAKITYDDDGKIKDLIIVDNNGEITFSTGNKSSQTNNSTSQSNEVLGGNYKFQKGKYAGKTISEIAKVDKGYLTYCQQNANVSEEIKRNINAFFEG